MKPLLSLEPAERRPRYEHKTPGEIIHIEIKELRRFNAAAHQLTGNRSRQANQPSNPTAPG